MDNNISKADLFLEATVKAAAEQGMAGFLITVLVPSENAENAGSLRSTAVGLGGYNLNDLDLILEAVKASQKNTLKALKASARKAGKVAKAS